MCLCIYVSMYVFMYVYMYEYMYVYMYVCMYVCVCVCMRDTRSGVPLEYASIRSTRHSRYTYAQVKSHI